MLNIQRKQQQQQEARGTPGSPSSSLKERIRATEKGHLNHCSDGAEVYEPTTSMTGSKIDTSGYQKVKESQISRSLAKSCTRGISSLLMPPSVRRKLEAMAEIQPYTNPFTPSSSQDAEDAIRYLLETTHRPFDLGDMGAFVQQAIGRSGRTYDPSSFDSQFTARIERPLQHTHLRELYKVEQEMHDMSDALSSISFTNSTMSEVDELEVLPYDIIQ